jgi:RNA polymerase sigma-70 factor (ECF subfamily)
MPRFWSELFGGFTARIWCDALKGSMNPQPHKPDLEAIFRECGGDLTAYFARRHPGADVAADLVQESFLQLAKRLASEKVLVSPRGYLFGIARHLSLAFFRSNEGKISEPVATETDATTQEPDWRIEAAREVIEGLPALQREILDLRFAHDLSYAEIAIALGIATGTVRSRLHNAIALLREKLEAEEKDPT